MRCKNCGAEIKDGNTFCAVCGQPVETEGVQKGKAGSPLQEAMQAGNGSVQKAVNQKKKPPVFKLGIILAILAALVVGGVAIAKVWKQFGISPAEYYQDAETKNRDAKSSFYFGYYDKFRQSFAAESFNKHVNMKAEFSDTAKALLSLSGVDCSKVNGLELDMFSGKEQEAYSTQVKARANDKDLVTLRTYVDLAGKKSYMQIPELTKSYLDSSAGMKEMEQDTDMNALLRLLDFGEILPEADKAEALYKRYTDLMIQYAENVEKTEGGCEAEGISQEADQYTVTLDAKQLVALVGDICGQLKEDKELKGLIEGVSKEAYQAFTGNVEDILDSVKNTGEDGKNETSGIFKAQIAENGTIIGRDITLKADGEEMQLAMQCPRDGDNFGYSLSIADNGTEYVTLRGKGTVKNYVINGEFTLSMDDSLKEGNPDIVSLEKALVVTLKDYDLAGLPEGKISGTVTYATEAFAPLANYSIQIASEGDMENTSSKVIVFAGQDAFMTMDVTMESGVEMDSIKPTANDTVYDTAKDKDIQAYQAEIDYLKFMQDLEDKLGIDLDAVISNMIL